MYRKKEMIALMLAFLITVAFMPAFAFAEDSAAPQKTVMNSHEENYEDTSDTADNDWDPLKPDELIIYDDEFDLVARGAEAEKWARKHRVSYPTSVKMTAGIEKITAHYLDSNVDFYQLYDEGNEFTVEYSYGDPEVYKCVEIDGDYEFFLEGDTSTPDNLNFFYSNASGDESLFTYKDGKGNNKGYFFYDTEAVIGGKTYTLRKASKEVTVPVVFEEVSAGIYDSEGRGYSEYTGKVQKIPLENVLLYPYVLDVVSITPKTDMKSIGLHYLDIKYDNSKGYYDTDTVETLYQIFPKSPTSVKLKNSKKNTVTVSWKYSNKANQKAIDAFKVQIYDSNDNLVVGKKVKKTKTSVTIKNSKLKKGKRYRVEVKAYKTIEDVDWTSDPGTKSIVIKK